MSPGEFADSLRAYCAATGGSVTSWGRTWKHHVKVSAPDPPVPNSAHLIWTGADVVYDSNGSPPPGVIEQREALAARLHLQLIHEGDHDHVQEQRAV